MPLEEGLRRTVQEWRRLSNLDRMMYYERAEKMEALVGPVHSGRGKSHAECGKDGNEPKQEEDDTYMDPCLLSYMDKQRSREDSVTKVVGVSDEACPPEIDFEALHRPIRTDTGPFVLRDFVPSRGRQAGKGGWTPGFPPQAPPPAAQLAPIIRPVNPGPWPHDTSREGRLATNQPNASQDGSSNPQREYSNFRRWQRFKPLARRHFRLSPDAEAFSCFLIPVLRSVTRLNPTMPLEEGLWRAVQEWRRLSNLDRMIYYERAEKFMEFAAEEEIHIQNLQCMQCAQDLPPPAPPKLDPRGPPAPKVHLQPGTQEIPPETVREYVDRMEALVGPVHSGRGKSHAECGKDGNEPKQEEDDTYMDPCLLSYMDKQRSREDSVTKVEAIIHPRFLAELFPPDPHLDLLALAEELKQKEGLTPEELVQKQLLDLKEDEGRQEVSPFRAGRPSPPQGQRHTGPLLGPRDASVLREASPVPEARGPRDASSEDEEALSSLAFLFASPQSLPPCGLSQSAAPASGLASPGAAAEKLPIPGAGHWVSKRPALALGLARPSQPRKRKGDPFVTGKRRTKKRKHCSL
ncbi:NUT family member 2G-like [Balaenoptera acutorostrata]|uniref:NUT family member 2G-like n=1 Tax=Balaenoptera acutorostrata TaxID=9767 RepID=A0ABM3TQJ8_BALAC|nr:NUT family member 2G-like [Balaenoptera acutorostrata]